MRSLLFKATSAVPLCRKLVGCPTENSQVHRFSAKIFLRSVHVQHYPVTDKFTKKHYIYQLASLLNFFQNRTKLELQCYNLDVQNFVKLYMLKGRGRGRGTDLVTLITLVILIIYVIPRKFRCHHLHAFLPVFIP